MSGFRGFFKWEVFAFEQDDDAFGLVVDRSDRLRDDLPVTGEIARTDDHGVGFYFVEIIDGLHRISIPKNLETERPEIETNYLGYAVVFDEEEGLHSTPLLWTT
jgi:hypothetical protein